MDGSWYSDVQNPNLLGKTRHGNILIIKYSIHKTRFCGHMRK